MSPPVPDPARELQDVDAAIARVVADHAAATGKPRFHAGRCGRSDLHQQLVMLHARKQELAAAIADGARRSQKLLRVLKSVVTRAG